MQLATTSGLIIDEKWEEDKITFHKLIAVSIPDNEFNQIKSTSHAKVMWEQLKVIYEGRTQVLLMNVWQQLQNMKCGENEDL